MERTTVNLKYKVQHGVRVEIKEMRATMFNFTSIDEAIEKLGKDVVLNYINYTHGLMERQRLISQAKKGT